MTPRITKTYCRVCEAACGLEVEHDAGGAPVRLRPDREHPISAGFACAKGTRFLEVAHHPERLTHPIVDGQRATWDQAIAAAAHRITAVRERYGPHSVGMYFGNPLAFNALGFVATLGFSKWLGTRNVFSASSQDCNNKFAAARLIHGSAAIHPVPDFEHCDLAVVLGSNPAVSQSSFVHLPRGSTVFDRLLARGGDVVWVDPRRTESVRRGGHHLAIRPGTDLWLLLALLGLLGPNAPADRKQVEGFDQLLALASRITVTEAATRTGLAEGDIRGLATRIAGARRCALHMSVGVNQGGFGTLSYVLLHALSWATGNFDARGGALVHPLAGALGKLFGSGVDPGHRSRIGDFEAVLGTLPGGILADEITEPGDGQIRAMIVIAGDPLRSIPGADRLERAFAQLETVIAIDMFRNQSGRAADVVLPATSWLERWDLASTTLIFQADDLVQIAGPAMPPVGESRSDARILCDLAIAMGSRNPLWRLARLPLDRWLPRPRFGVRTVRPQPGRWLRRHRLRLWAPWFVDELARLRGTDGRADDELTLLCRRRRLGHNSWLHGGRRDGNAEATAGLAAVDMTRLGLVDGDTIEVETSAGRLQLPVMTDDGLAPHTIVVPHGLPTHNINAVIPSGAAAIERVSGNHVMTGIAARVRRVAAG